MGRARQIQLALAAVGAAALLAAPGAWASDSMGSPTPLANGVAVTEPTGAYGVETGEQHTGAPWIDECGSGHHVGAARTAWYTIQGSGGQVTITTAGSDFDTTLFAYTNNAAGPVVTCDDDSGGGTTSSITFATTAGTTYAIQAGSACNDLSPCKPPPAGGTLKIVSTQVAPNHDLEGDGFVGAQFGGPDCNDGNPAIHPGAADAPHDGIDQDCSGADAPYPALAAKSTMAVLFFSRFTKVAKLDVAGAPAGASILLSCSSRKRGCPFTSKKIAATGARSQNILKQLKKAQLKKNAVVTIRVTKPGFIGTYEKFTIRILKLPKKQTLCTQPGASQPQAACS
ncbi:MAG: hypothetical protein JWN32_4485 [Solirubrobacterales bacterium]|nr:hypothetical protein [Solirubrobacterales bacterium]